MSALLKQHLKPFERYFKRSDLVEISINQPGEVALKTTSGAWERVQDKALTLQSLNDLAAALATVKGQRYGDNTPMLGTVIPGYNVRIQVVGSSVADSGFICSIRVPQPGEYPVEGYFDEPAEAAKLISAVAEGHGKTIVVAGPMGSGKTTFANSLIARIPQNKRFLVVEDAKELIIKQWNVARIIKSKSGTDIAGVTYTQITDALKRLAPDWILFGELDSKNTASFLDIAGAGHPCMTTLHADTLEKAKVRAVLMGQAGGLEGGAEVVKNIMQLCVHAVVFIQKNEKKRTFRAVVEYL